MTAAPNHNSYDAVVIGGGLIGLACAWRAVQRGLSVALLERDAPGAGATGVAAGMLAPVTEADFGEEDLLALNLASARRWPNFAAELEDAAGLPTGYTRSGALAVAADRDDAAELRRLHELQARHGLDAEWLPPGACRNLEPGLAPRIAGGILVPDDHHVDPAAVAAALCSALERAGGEIIRGTEVCRVRTSEGGVEGVETQAGTIACDQVVIAAGAWTSLLDGVGSLPIRPVKGQLLRLRTSAPDSLPQRIIRTPHCYVLNRGDGRVVLGATMEERGFDTAPTADGVYTLLEAALEVLPEVRELEWTGTVAGLRPATPDNRPLIGPGAVGGLVWAAGHHRNGVLLAPVTADAVGGALAGEGVGEGLDAVSPARFANAVAQ